MKLRTLSSFLSPLFLAAGIVAGGATQAKELEFKRHDLNARSAYSACAVFDINHDGKLDVFCGGWWYEAPSWRHHFVRDVPIIRSRYDGYSHLPFDVNRDGWLDVIEVNYRSRSLFWVQHPGPSLGPWKKRPIGEPGPMETGRLFDVDGDGQLDILPNAVRSPAWWELTWKESVPGGVRPSWIQHPLPRELLGHGIGFGDIDGDGRGDVVGIQGWAAAPRDRRNGSWEWHPEFRLSPDSSIPILVVDVDDDWDADIVWGRGHNYGLYWLEQQQDGSARRWVRHAIDERWSQAHALLWEDLDRDGRKELIAGKRFMAHEGKDPGAYDPLCIYRYQFDPSTRRWHRHPISEGGQVGFGLDPKAADLDGDGDLDLVVSGRSGLYWLENLLP